MTSTTNASWQAEDAEKARYLTFDPAYYQVGGLASDDGSTVASLSTPTSPVIQESRVFATFDYSTRSVTPESIRRQAEILGEKGARGWFRFIIRASRRWEDKETVPTSDPEVPLAGLIDRFRHHPRIVFAKRIAARLDHLLEVSREEQPEQAPPVAASLEGLLAFLSRNPGLAYPDIVLTPDGYVRAQWRRGPTQHFAVEFREDEGVRFVIFVPDPRRPYKRVRVSGTATVDSIMGQAHYYKVLDWASAENEQAA